MTVHNLLDGIAVDITHPTFERGSTWFRFLVTGHDFGFGCAVYEGEVPNIHISFDEENGLYIYICIDQNLRLTYDEVQLWKWHHGPTVSDVHAA